MSTKSNPLRLGGGGATVLLSLWLVACASAWDASTTSGGRKSDEASLVASEVGKAFSLTPACTAHAAAIAEASMKARITAYRPTSRLMQQKEDEALEGWRRGMCPDRALLGVAYGVSHSVNADEAARRRGERFLR